LLDPPPEKVIGLGLSARLLKLIPTLWLPD